MTRSLAATVFIGLLTAGACVAEDDVLIDGVPLTDIRTELRSGDMDAKIDALLLVQRGGVTAAAAAPEVRLLLYNEDHFIQGLAVRAMGGLGEAAAPALSKLAEMAENHPDQFIRQDAAQAVTDIQESAGISEIIRDPDASDAGLAPDPEVGPAELVPLIEIPPGDDSLTAFLGPLRQHKRDLQQLHDRIRQITDEPPQTQVAAELWVRKLKAAGNDLTAEIGAFRATLSDFINSPTRHGLDEELTLIDECLQLGADSGGFIDPHTQFDINAYSARQNLQQEASQFKQRAVSILARHIDCQLKAEGLFEVLVVDGVEEVKSEVIGRLGEEAVESIGEITEDELGVNVHDALSFRTTVKAKGRAAVRRLVGKLLVNITTNEIVIEIVGQPIIRWVETDLWPKLKAVFRNRGDLQFRTERSIASLQAARMRLWALEPDAPNDQVIDTWAGARGASKATIYLVGDLQRADREDLLTKLKAAIEDLDQLLDLTARRFLLNKLDELEQVPAKQEVARALQDVLTQMVQQIEKPAVVADTPVTPATPDTPPQPDQPDQPGRPPNHTFEYPRYLVHVTLTRTMGGPVEKDWWILSGHPPEADGSIRTADGFGGTFGHETDAHYGPFEDTWSLMPVMVRLGVEKVRYGQTYLVADPAVWGRGAAPR